MYMKRNLTFMMAMAAMAFISCSREQAGPVESGRFEAVAETVTRVALSDGGAFSWTAGDAVALVTDAGIRPFELIAGAGQARATFDGDPTGITSATAAFYPASIAKDAATVTLPETYTWAEGQTFAAMMASPVSLSGVNSFKHLGAVIKIVYNEVPADADAIVFKAGAKVTGDFAVSGGQIVSGEGESTVTVGFPAGSAPKAFYIPVPTGTFTFSVSLAKAGAAIAGTTRTTSEAKTLKRAELLLMGAADELPEGKTATAYKVLPRLAVFDWGEYEKGTGTNGQNGTPRSYIVYLLDKDGQQLRVQGLTTGNFCFNGKIFFGHNRYAFGGLTPDTDYIFRLVTREVGPDKLNSKPFDLPFHTPAEVIPENALVYKDFDNWWMGGCLVYQAWSCYANVDPNRMFSSNPDLSDPAVQGATNNRPTNPCYSVQKLLNYAGSTGGWVTSDTCPKVWDYYWEGSRYGTNYADADYAGWQAFINGSKGDVRHMTGAVLIGTNSVNASYLRTPFLAGLGETPSNVTVKIHSAPYIEPFNIEGAAEHLIRIVGPGRFTDGGATLAEKVSDTEIRVTMKSNMDPATKGFVDAWTVTTEHVVKIEGATKATKIEIANMPTVTAPLLVDDILVTKD